MNDLIVRSELLLFAMNAVYYSNLWHGFEAKFKRLDVNS